MADADLDAAVRVLHDAHAPALRAWARQRTGDDGEADEVVQETLVRAWRGRAGYDPARGSERAWLFGIARNAAVDLHRRRGRHLRAVPSAEVPEAEDDGALDRAVETSHVRDALWSLSEAHRRVVIEAYFRGRTVREVAELLAIPEGTVKSRLYHALRALRRELEHQEVL